jgi:hypothetical protein
MHRLHSTFGDFHCLQVMRGDVAFVDCLLYSAFNRVSGFALAYNHKSDYQRERKIGGKNAETKQK